jgi:hypothetical protein
MLMNKVLTGKKKESRCCAPSIEVHSLNGAGAESFPLPYTDLDAFHTDGDE